MWLSLETFAVGIPSAIEKAFCRVHHVGSIVGREEVAKGWHVCGTTLRVAIIFSAPSVFGKEAQSRGDAQSQRDSWRLCAPAITSSDSRTGRHCGAMTNLHHAGEARSLYIDSANNSRIVSRSCSARRGLLPTNKRAIFPSLSITTICGMESASYLAPTNPSASSATGM